MWLLTTTQPWRFPCLNPLLVAGKYSTFSGSTRCIVRRCLSQSPFSSGEVFHTKIGKEGHHERRNPNRLNPLLVAGKYSTSSNSNRSVEIFSLGLNPLLVAGKYSTNNAVKLLQSADLIGETSQSPFSSGEVFHEFRVGDNRHRSRGSGRVSIPF